MSHARVITLTRPERGPWIVSENGRYIELSTDEALFAVASLLIKGADGVPWHGMESLERIREQAAAWERRNIEREITAACEQARRGERERIERAMRPVDRPLLRAALSHPPATEVPYF